MWVSERRPFAVQRSLYTAYLSCWYEIIYLRSDIIAVEESGLSAMAQGKKKTVSQIWRSEVCRLVGQVGLKFTQEQSTPLRVHHPKHQPFHSETPLDASLEEYLCLDGIWSEST